MQHCTKGRNCVTKVMSMHGVLDKIQDHGPWRLVGGMWKKFKYAEPFSHHNRAKHWVDEVNNCCQDPIGLEEVWAAKWWSNQHNHFSFVGRRGECSAGLGAWEEGNSNAEVGNLQETGNADDAK